MRMGIKGKRFLGDGALDEGGLWMEEEFSDLTWGVIPWNPCLTS